MGFDEFIDSRGGIVSRRELLAAGWTADDLRLSYGYWRRPQRLRRGWYCSENVPELVKEAWRHGGPLACVSALAWHDAAALGTVPILNRPLHVCLPRHAHQRRNEAHESTSAILHWHAAAQDPLARWAVPREVARAQARFCAH